MRSSHPIQVPIKNAEEVEEIFDSISYCKGSCVVRLIYRALGPEAFQKGLQNYMQKYKYGNTQTKDLWQEWTNVSNVNVQEMMGTWTEVMGFPLLKVEKAGNNLAISQQWYLGDGSVQEGDEKSTWVVPVVIGNKEKEELHFLKEKTGSFPVPAGKWAKVNFGQYVPLRVKYSDELLKNLIDNIGEIPGEDRIGLLQDCFALFKSNHMSGTQVVDLISGFGDEENTNVWDALSAIITAFDKLFLELPAVYENFKKFAGNLIFKQSSRLGWDHKAGDSDLIKQLRGNLISLQAKYCQDNDVVKKEANARFDAFLEDNLSTKLPNDYKRAAFTLVLNQAGRAETAFEQLQKISQNSATEQPTRLAIYFSLGTVNSSALQQRILEWALTDEVRKQDFFYCFLGVVGSSKAGSDLGFKFMQDKWEELKVKASTSSILQTCVKILASGNSYERVKEVDAFFKDKDTTELMRTLSQIREGTVANAKVIEDIIKPSELVTDAYWKKFL